MSLNSHQGVQPIAHQDAIAKPSPSQAEAPPFTAQEVSSVAAPKPVTVSDYPPPYNTVGRK